MGGCTWRPTVSQSPDWFLHLSPTSLEVDYLQFLLRVVVEGMAFHHPKYQLSMMIQMKNQRDLAYCQLFWVFAIILTFNHLCPLRRVPSTTADFCGLQYIIHSWSHVQGVTLTTVHHLLV